MRAIVALVALLLLSGQGIDPLAPSQGEASAPAASPSVAAPSVSAPAPPPAATAPPAPVIGTVSPADPPAAAKAAKAPAKDAKAKAGTAAPGQPEVLPWANAPKAAPGAVGAPATGAEKTAAASPCNGLLEDGCRGQKKACAWIADMKTEDGTLVPGRCASRPQAPVKKAQAAKPKPKPPAAAPAEAAAPASTGAAPPAPDAAAAPAAAPKSPVIITVNPPKAPAPAEDPAAAEGIPTPAPE
jgi:hypothetical protein